MLSKMSRKVVWCGVVWCALSKGPCAGNLGGRAAAVAAAAAAASLEEAAALCGAQIEEDWLFNAP